MRRPTEVGKALRRSATRAATIVAAIVGSVSPLYAGDQPVCPYALAWNTTLQTWCSGAPWIKILREGDVATAKGLGCRVFFRPYNVPGNDDGGCTDGAAHANNVLALLNKIPRDRWPDAVGYRNEFDGDGYTPTQFIPYYDTLRTGGYDGIIVYGSYGPGGPDISEYGRSDVQAAINKADAVETHEYFDLTVKYYDSWTSHRHVRAMEQYPYLRYKPWFIGEFGSDACPYDDREDACLRRGWRDTANCGQPKLTAEEYQTQIGIYRYGDPADGVLAVADNVVAVFLFAQAGGSTWRDFEVLNTPVATYMQNTWAVAPGSISGCVKDRGNNPVPGATVRTSFGQHAGPGPYETTTDAGGNYVLTGVAPWMYTVVVSKNHYESVSKAAIQVLYATTTTCDFTQSASSDFDRDGDVDLPDFTVFQLCFNGPNRPRTSNCTVDADFDNDGDVDLGDFSVFQLCFNGPNHPPACE
jgi:hypothetical protein